MKKIVPAVLAIALTLISCDSSSNKTPDWAAKAIRTADGQLMITASLIDGTDRFPQSIVVDRDFRLIAEQLGVDPAALPEPFRNRPAPESFGTLTTCGIFDWTSGFFAGSLWYAYELTGDPETKEVLRAEAVRQTNRLNDIRHYRDNHDLGFMIGSSYGNALRLSPNDTIRSVIVETADNLLSRFRPAIGCTLSWSGTKWNFPVIIDNMMNLELLFEASKLSGDPKYRDAAVSHADKTMANHFRDDYTSWHVVSYNDDGTVECKKTSQGRSDDSAWARGQAWALYGFTMCYRETGNEAYLDFAGHIADMIMERVTTDDTVPYWDYDAPALPDTPRDASAAAVTASAMMELSTFASGDDARRYFAYGEKILKSLSSEAYMSKPGENCGFILLHSVSSLPAGVLIDAPLTYADYYYLEALKRYLDLLPARR